MAENIRQIQNKGLDTSLLDNLSPAERELALSILKEYTEKGKSQKLDDLILDDYAEIPVDIETFVDDNEYLGNAWHDSDGKSKLYPYWRKELHKIFPDNLNTNVNNGIFSGSRGRGKAQPLDALVFTADGYRKMGDLKVGDKVYGRDGNLYPILGIYPQGKKKIIQITFSDGTKTKCSDQHLWTVKDNNINKFITITAKQIYENGIYKRKLENGWTEKRYSLPKLEPLKYKHKEHLISPYMLGCLLGDGCFSQCIGMTTADEEIKNYFIKELSKNEYEIHNHSKDKKDICFYIKNKNYTSSSDKNIYWEEIKRLGLAKHTSYDKFIPNEYLYSDINDRIELLQGLLDTDGECRKDGQISFASTSKKLIENIIWLVQSLGGLATNYKDISHKYHYINKKNNIDEVRDAANVYSVGIKLPKNIQPFKLKRKLERLNPNRIEPKRRIIDIKYLKDEEECQCIYIGSEEHLYLTNDLIVTHNTEIAVLIAAYLLHRILCLKDPVAYFHLKPTEKIVFAFMNIKLALAEEIGVAKFQNTIQSSPWFMAHGTIEGRTKKIWVPQKYNGQEAIDIKIGSQADDLIGLPVYFCFCLDGDTKIKTTEGIRALKDLQEKNIRVLSVDNFGNEIISAPCTVKPTAISDVEYEIELEDGTIIKCTPNHQFLLNNGTYKRADELLEQDEFFSNEMYGYIYKTTNLINGKQYIGKHKSKTFEFDKYKGSGIRLREAFRKYGKENFKTELLISDGIVSTICQSESELNNAEAYYIKKYDCIRNNLYYNFAEGGQGGDIYNTLSKEKQIIINQKKSVSLKETFGKIGEDYYRKRAEKKRRTLSNLSDAEKLRRKKINSEAQKKANMEMCLEAKKLRSLRHKQSIANRTDEQEKQRKLKEKITKENKSLQEKQEISKKLSIAAKGKRVYTNGVDVIRAYPGMEPNGYYLGGGNKNKFKYYYYYQNQRYADKSLLVIELQKIYPNLILNNIDSIIRETSQAKKRFPLLIGLLVKENR